MNTLVSQRQTGFNELKKPIDSCKASVVQYTVFIHVCMPLACGVLAKHRQFGLSIKQNILLECEFESLFQNKQVQHLTIMMRDRIIPAYLG